MLGILAILVWHGLDALFEMAWMLVETADVAVAAVLGHVRHGVFVSWRSTRNKMIGFSKAISGGRAGAVSDIKPRTLFQNSPHSVMLVLTGLNKYIHDQRHVYFSLGEMTGCVVCTAENYDPKASRPVCDAAEMS